MTSTPHVLVVDDDADMRDLLVVLVGDLGLVAETANDGVEAWERLSQGGIDLVISDVMMPRLNGIGLLERLKGSTVNADVLMISAESDISMAVNAMRLGAVGFLEKPLTPLAFQGELRRALVARAARLAQVQPPGPPPMTLTQPVPGGPPAPPPSDFEMPPDTSPINAEDESDPNAPRIGRYVVIEVLGQGGSGAVYRCYDPRIRRYVAIKVLKKAPGGRSFKVI